MEPLFLGLIAMITVVLQTTLVPQFFIGAAAPDLVFFLVIFCALQRQTTLGLWMGFGAGLLQDISAGGPLGLRALSLLGLAYLITHLRKQFFKENLSAQILLLLICTFLHQFFLFFWMNTVLETGYRFQTCLWRAVLMSISHSLLGPIIFIGLRHLIAGEDVYRHVIHGHHPFSRTSSLRGAG